MDYITYPLRSHSPVELKSRDITQELCPAKLATCSPELTSYKPMTLASPAAANSVTAGEKATALTGCVCPKTLENIPQRFARYEPGSECSNRPESLLKMYILPFSCPEAVNLPSAL
jgi:hypothetical protein